MPKFPFTNYHELNLDWILKKVTALFDASEENAATIRTYNARLTNAEQTATNAETAATAAQQLADAAADNADSALSVAGTADAKADSALTAATNAAGAVAGALTAAQEAQQTAAAAVATANDAAATASSLESLANTANQNATAALETAQTADQKAVAAQNTSTTNAGNISTLQTNVSNLNRQISESITPAIEEIETALDGKAPVIINTASGDIASFDDGAEGMPVKSLIVNIEPVQEGSGDPSPDNVRPISGWTGASVTRTGKNLLDNEHATVYNRYIQYYDTNNANWVESSDSASYCIFVKPNTSYAIKAHGDTTVFRACAISVDPSTIGSNTIHSTNAYSANAGTYKYCVITTGSTETWLVLQLSKTVVENGTGMAMVELGNTYSDYEPYQGNQISVTFPSSAGTVYGGTLTLNPDRTGTLVVDKASVNLGTLTMTWDANVFGGVFYRSFDNADYADNGDAICSALKSVLSGSELTQTDNAIYAKNNGQRFYLKMSKYAGSLTQLQEALSGETMVYRCFPTTYQLTESEISGILTTLYGTNNIWTDVGTVDVEYPADTKLYIEQLTKPTEDDMIADHAISSGTFFMVGNNLYLATSQIAAGGTITPGTNATQLSLADALNQLNT